jgi:hypothetical protein
MTYFSDIADINLNRNIWFDAQAQSYVLEIYYNDRWMEVGYYDRERQAELESEVITIDELKKLS